MLSTLRSKPPASSGETELPPTRRGDSPSRASSARGRPRDAAEVLVELLELDDVREDVLHDVLGVVRLHRQLLRDAHDVGRLAHEVVQVGVGALVRDLRQTGLLRGERLVQVEQLQLRVGELSGSDWTMSLSLLLYRMRESRLPATRRVRVTF